MDKGNRFRLFSRRTTQITLFWMDIPQPSFTSTSALAGLQPSMQEVPATPSEQLAPPLTENERAASWKQLSSLHRGNRFRLMFGMPLLPEDPGNGNSR